MGPSTSDVWLWNYLYEVRVRVGVRVRVRVRPQATFGSGTTYMSYIGLPFDFYP